MVTWIGDPLADVVKRLATGTSVDSGNSLQEERVRVVPDSYRAYIKLGQTSNGSVLVKMFSVTRPRGVSRYALVTGVVRLQSVSSYSEAVVKPFTRCGRMILALVTVTRIRSLSIRALIEEPSTVRMLGVFKWDLREKIWAIPTLLYKAGQPDISVSTMRRHAAYLLPEEQDRSSNL